MKCLIIAAGRGSRLVNYGSSKPLVPLCGVPLIERVIYNCMRGGINQFVVVTGYEAKPLTCFLEQLADRADIEITTIHNPEWQSDNGLSVLAAKDLLDTPFLLQMADHLLEPGLIKQLQRATLPQDSVVLAVDYRMDNPLVDLDDVTRVQVEEGKILHIGKHLEVYNAYDTGIFLCTPQLFTALETSSRMLGDATLSGGIRNLTSSGNAFTFDCQSAFWLDVDAPQDYINAEEAINRNLGQMGEPVSWSTKS